MVITWDTDLQLLSYYVEFNGRFKLAGKYAFSSNSNSYNSIYRIFGNTYKVHFGYTASTGKYYNNQKILFVNPCEDLPLKLDTDGDGIFDELDLDSDNDGCVDAIEGSADIYNFNLVNSGGVVKVGSGSSARNENLCANNNCVDSNGVPFLDPQPKNYSNGGGQGIGDSKIRSKNDQCQKADCLKSPIGGTPGGYTKIGITDQQKQQNWPYNIPNGWIALESKTKGMVITRVANQSAIKEPKEGMIIYDIAARCIKLYDGSRWKCIERNCN